MSDWHHHAERLAAELPPRWRAAVTAVPRHVLVPHFFLQNDDASWTGGEDLDTIYSDTTLITTFDGPRAVSSSTAPSLMIRMLDALDLHDGHRVLEIGTGTGYNAALLSNRLGSGHVFSVDLDETLVERARERLAEIGHTPTIVAGDGELGLAEHAPYDRIIATCAVPRIPRDWIDQTTEGGLILADFKPAADAGNLVLLERRGDTAKGRFLSEWAGFMPMRHHDTTTPPHPVRDRTHAHTRPTTVPQPPWDYPVPWFLAQFGMPPNLTYGHGPDYIFLATTDGSWCEVGAGTVTEKGPLWTRFEAAYEQWRVDGEPSWSRFGLRVSPESHEVWMD